MEENKGSREDREKGLKKKMKMKKYLKDIIFYNYKQ